MKKQPPIDAYKNRGQGVFLVLYALNDLGGSNSKREVLDHIRKNHWYEITRHDLPRYAGQNEPKYETLLARARKDCYQRGWLIETDLKDNWYISRDGRDILERAIKRYRERKWDVRKCYLWTKRFKELIDPEYTPSDKDAQRPEERSLLDEYIVDL